MKINANNINVIVNNHKILTDITFELNTNDVVALVGSNGSGKSTLINVLANTIKFDGELLMDGKDIRTKNRANYRKVISVSFQNPDLQLFEKTVIKEVEQSLIINGTNKKEANKEALVLLKRFKFQKLANINPYSLSAGEKRILLIIIAISRKPELLLFDEITSNLDNKSTVMVTNFLKKIKDIIIVFSTHDFRMAKLLSNKVMIIESGEIKTFDDTKKIRRRNE